MFKNTYPRFSVLFLALFLFINCSKNVQKIPDTPWPVLSEREALEEFAVILSEAVTGNEEMRVFLKEEALKEFDKDNDVFYPYVKEHIFGSGRSFREELVLHEKYEHQMEAIERAIPKLTVLVPDFSWIDSNCFGIRSWDTKDDKVCVGFDDREDEHYMYHNGKYLGTLPASTFPSFPVLIVKSNERMLVTTTKSGEMDYSFVNSAFDGMSVTKGSIEE